MEIEFVALSRGVPRMFALLVNPYLRSIPRDCLTNYIHATQKALSPNDSEPGRGTTVKVEIQFRPASYDNASWSARPKF